MASLQEPEVLLAQRLASNEKPIRSQAIKKLRKYIAVRSQNASGGFTSDELLKLWKGLFYCLWMQDKLLLQEELSNKISTLIHHFHHTDQQLLYMESFLQTLKREWTGIDRLRMDKFYQMVRFMFRQTFEALRRQNWENSVVAKFLQLLTSHLLQTDSGAPSGLQLHILNLYLSELAAVGAAELTADQNLTFIEPFCKTAAKTKNQMLFSAICSSIFSTIIDQAPFAVEDLMKEVNDSDSDSGQASEEEDGCEEDNMSSKAACRRKSGRQIDGNKPNNDEEEDYLSHLEDSESMHEDVGPVLQFDFAAVAQKLLELASRSNTPGHNRKKLYKIIKVLRDLNEGVFPQDEYPEEVSTDEDDDMFGSRKMMKRSAHRENEEEASATKKRKETEEPDKQNNTDSADVAVSNAKKKKRKRKKKKAEHEGVLECAQELATEARLQSSSSSSQVSESPSEPQPPARVTEPSISSGKDPSEKKKGNFCVSEAGGSEGLEEQKSCPAAEASVLVKKKKRKSLPAEADREITPPDAPAPSPTKNKQKGQMVKTFKPPVDAESVSEDVRPADCPESPAVVERTSAKKTRRKKSPKTAGQQEVIADAEGVEAGASEADGAPTPQKKKKNQKRSAAAGEEAPGPQLDAETAAQKKKKGPKLNGSPLHVDTEPVSTEADLVTPARKTPTKRKRKIPVEFEFEADEVDVTPPVNDITGAELNSIEDVGTLATPLSLKKLQKKKKKTTSVGVSGSDFITFQSKAPIPKPLFCKSSRSPNTPLPSKKKRRTPKSEPKKVTFGLRNNKTAEFRKTDRSLLLSPEGSSRVPFDPEQKPKFGVLKSQTPPGTSSRRETPSSSSKKTQRGATKGRPLAADFF